MKVKQIGIAIIAFTLLIGEFVWAQNATQEQSGTSPQTGQAQPEPGYRGGRRGGRGKGGFEQMAKRLNLTQDQQEKLQTLRDQTRQQVQAVRQDSSLTPEQKQDKIKQIRQQSHEQMQSILTPEQQQQLKTMRESREGMGRGMAALNLTPDQKSKLAPIFQSSREQMQAVRNDSSLTLEQKRQKMQEIRTTMQSQVKSILTPEQQQQWQQMRDQRGRHGQYGAPPSGPGGS